MITQIFLPLIFTIATATGTGPGFAPNVPDACPVEPATFSAAWADAEHSAVILCAPADYQHDPETFIFYEDGSAQWLAYDEPTGFWISASACLTPAMGCSPERAPASAGPVEADDEARTIVGTRRRPADQQPAAQRPAAPARD